MAKKCSNINVRYEAGTGQGTLLATWDWQNYYTEKYSYQWQYSAGQGWLLDSEGSVEYRSGVSRSSTVNVRDNAKLYRFRVKPISKTHKVKKTKKVNGKKKTYEVTEAYFNSDWSSWKQVDIRSQRPPTPSAPNTSMMYTKKRIVASIDINLSNSGVNRIAKIVFQLYNATRSVEAERKTANVSTQTGRASVNFDITNDGCAYRVRCYAIDTEGQESSQWSVWSPTPPEALRALPVTPSKIESLKLVTSENNIKTVELSWKHPGGKVDSYELQYTTNKNWFDTTTKVKTETPNTNSWIFDLSTDSELSGNTWYFRLRSVNETGHSEWCPISMLTIGEKPNPPTTWSSKTTAISGDLVPLYWVHNTVDGSRETAAQIQIIVNGVVQSIIPIDNNRSVEETIGEYVINTGAYADGAKFEWRVRTKGIYDEYSDWSITRLINIVSPPVLELGVSEENSNWYWDLLNFNTGNIFTTEGEIGEQIETLTQYPFYISALAGPTNQSVIRWYVSIISNDDSYESLDEDGTLRTINKGDILYSKHFDNDGDNRLFLTMSPTDVLLANNASYKITVKAVMNTGLSVVRERDIDVRLGDDDIDISAAISIDDDLVAAYITPVAVDPDDENETPLTNVFFNIFRLNYDGSFTEIDSRIDSALNTTVIDFHPALDKARYRIVAVSKTSGSIVYEDFSEYIEESDIIIQWNERKNEDLQIDSDDITDESVLSGEFLRLPWNIDTTEGHDRDVEFVNYIGREHPVDYHGTQLGETATWNTDVDKEDTDTIYALRRLSIYKGHVYVREPSGVGYWAVVKVSFTNTHNELVIPVTLAITRVEGGA